MFDKDKIKAKMQEGVDGAKRFNSTPPAWFYFAAFIVIVFLAQLLRQL